MRRTQHWNDIYQAMQATDVSWFQTTPTTSLSLVADSGVMTTAPLIDVGGGASTLIDHLLAAGYEDITVLDIAKSALAQANARLGTDAADVHWLVGDVTTIALPENQFALWHDRAVFHFLTDVAERARYVAQVERVIRPNGTLIVATFAEDGPERCSNLPVQRYSTEQLAAQFGRSFTLEQTAHEAHTTPWGSVQKFVYVRLRRN